MSDKSLMHGGGESYSGVVPTKQPNKSGPSPAEVAEGRPLTKEIARAPKLGVLTLAGVLEQAGLRPRIFDLDDAYADYLAEACHRGLEGFPAWVAPRILSSDACIFGFSSLCSSYPVSIRIAERVKREAPRCTILFGGPQASAVDLPTLSAFPFVDFVLRGEADLSLPLFLDQWSGERRFLDVPGLTWRSPSGPRRNPDAPVIDNLDDSPAACLPSQQQPEARRLRFSGGGPRLSVLLCLLLDQRLLSA
jgi:radical SAM superfamily enzyme YgiQ (UPF0313 family)